MSTEPPSGSTPDPRPSRAPATIRDVARAAGVSPATVSRVLTGTKPVSAQLADRVRGVADRLGYRPNPAAQVLLRGSAHTVGVVVPDLANPYFAELLKGVTAAAAGDGRHTLVADANEDPREEHRAATGLARWVDGLVLCSPRMSAADLTEVAAAVPALVVVNRLVRHPGVASVVVDYHRGMARVCDHLRELGHRHVAYLQGPARAWSERQRQRALRTAARTGLRVDRIPCGSATVDGYRATDRALTARPTAILAFSDHVALGVLTRLAELGIRVPDEISLTGFDDIPLSGLTGPGLTTVTVDRTALGRLAVERLRERIEGSRPAVAVRFPVELVARGSTAVSRRRR